VVKCCKNTEQSYHDTDRDTRILPITPEPSYTNLTSGNCNLKPVTMVLSLRECCVNESYTIQSFGFATSFSVYLPEESSK
jgi:hypothetical protein